MSSFQNYLNVHMALIASEVECTCVCEFKNY